VPPLTTMLLHTSLVPPLTTMLLHTSLVPPLTTMLLHTSLVPPLTTMLLHTSLVPPLTTMLLHTSLVPPLITMLLHTSLVPPLTTLTGPVGGLPLPQLPASRAHHDGSQLQPCLIPSPPPHAQPPNVAGVKKSHARNGAGVLVSISLHLNECQCHL